MCIRDRLEIDLTQMHNSELSQLEMFDLQGRSVWEEPVQSSKLTLFVKVGSFPAGWYFIKISSTNETILTRKIEVVH